MNVSDSHVFHGSGWQHPYPVAEYGKGIYRSTAKVAIDQGIHQRRTDLLVTRVLRSIRSDFCGTAIKL